jgi:hypothetical protein
LSPLQTNQIRFWVGVTNREESSSGKSQPQSGTKAPQVALSIQRKISERRRKVPAQCLFGEPLREEGHQASIEYAALDGCIPLELSLEFTEGLGQRCNSLEAPSASILQTASAELVGTTD